jgi:hypothetical protein
VERIVNAEMKKQYAPICGRYGTGASDRWPYHLLGASITFDYETNNCISEFEAASTDVDPSIFGA